MKTLYPIISPFNHFLLHTGSVHQVYVEQSGNPQGIPVIFLHGGPCSGTKPDHRRFFNPDKYHIILMDQRGCGQSLPFGEIIDNTTQDLINDMERIRQQLNIQQWLLFGGSWGSALTLLYAQQYKSAVLGMVIRGVFLARQMDLDWFAKGAAGRIYPEVWQQLQSSVSVAGETELVKSLYSTVFGNDELAKRRAANAWINWGGQVALMQDYQTPDKPVHVTEAMVQQVQMEMHYAHNHYFITENQILEHCHDLQDIPCMIIHGRRDLVCPVEAGVSLAKVLPDAEFILLDEAGHIASGESMIATLVDATDKMLELVQ